MSDFAGSKLFFIFVLSLASMLILSGAAFSQDGKVNVKFSSADYDIQQTDSQDEIFIEGFGRNLIPGMPNLPANIFAIAIPPGAEVTGVDFNPGQGIELPGTYQVPPAVLPRVIGEEDPALFARDQELYQQNYDAVYNSDNAYPAAVGEFVRRAGYRKYNLVDVRISPFAYKPKSQKLIHYPAISVDVHYTLPMDAAPQKVWTDNLVRTETVARDIVLNYDQAQGWYPGSDSAASRGLHDFVIITLPSLTSAVQSLVTWEAKKERTVEVVTTTWISSNYSGFDLAEQMRNFLRDKYPSAEWGIEDVLLVGHYDDVPMRRCWQDKGYGKPETDYYFAELSHADTDSWDKDGDQHWGENSDPIDFYCEINVGRIPWSNAATVQSICDKSVAYELNDDLSFKNNILLLGAYFWNSTDNAVLMEYKTNPAHNPWMADWTSTKMYESGHSIYPMDYNLTYNNVKNYWSAGKYSFVNWAGHGSPSGCYLFYSSGAFVNNSSCGYLNDDYPSVIFAAACSNSDTDSLNIGQSMLKQGGVGFVGATKVAYGSGGWSNPNHGSCQSFDYHFTTKFTSGDYTQGQAHQWALRKMYTGGLWYYTYYEMFEWGALWGNPDLGLGEVLVLNLDFPEGLPAAHCPPGLETELLIEIKDGLESYVPGSGYLHYRYDPGDSFTVVALTSLGSDLYQAVLPTTQPGDMPEYYFSAEGDGGSTLYMPPGAPANVYSFDLYFEQISWVDDFESDEGWTVQSSNLQNGEWERGAPVFNLFQPGSDHSADGTLCFVTNKDGLSGSEENDVDGGPTVLTSPTIDLSEGDANLSFYLWFYHTFYGEAQPLEIDLSNDNGSTWQRAMDVDVNTLRTWELYSIRVSDYVAPTSQVKIRFTVSDNPDDDTVEALVDDFVVTRLVNDPVLWADGYSIPVSTGAVIDFSLDAGPGYAYRSYLLLGSMSGSWPGTKLPGGEVLPLNWDDLTRFVIALLNSPVCVNFQGNLDGAGSATATLNSLGSLDPILEGLSMQFAYLLRPPPGYDFVSNAVPVTFDP